MSVKLEKAISELRAPYKDDIRMAAMGLRTIAGLCQIIVGPARSGKTEEAFAYAEALAELGLVKDVAPVVIDGSRAPDDKELAEKFREAEGKVLIIDEIYKIPKDTRIGMLLMEVYDKEQCVVVLTGHEAPLNKFLEDVSPEVRARMPNGPIKTEKIYGIGERSPRQIRQQKAAEQAAAEAREKNRREAWEQLARDVSLREPISARKPIVFIPRKPVS